MSTENIEPELKGTEKAVEETRDSTEATADMSKTGYIKVGEIRASKEYIREAELIREFMAKAKPESGDKTTVDEGLLAPTRIFLGPGLPELFIAAAGAHGGVETDEFEKLSAKTTEILQVAALAHERIAKDQQEIEQLKTETRAMLAQLRAA
jgi:hypothetical protein